MPELVYAELRRVAQQQFARERAGHTWQPTVLVHEAWLRLGDATALGTIGLASLRARAARVMRELLVDYARQRRASRRGGDRQRVTFVADEWGEAATTLDLLALDEELRRLEAASPRQARVVELRCFGGLSVAETAHELGVSERTVKGDYRVALARLRYGLGGGTSA